ncbi:hypothetical protein [Enterovibrio baiacu]|uniref:hypothetical protein n=1 Tax=Enterovibrio baiacu TaxID=2491023 RepID=UPI0010129692|nr:hypothetical protein [Enterovibrio baiacu]MBE1276801.1 hypothetical protein [Enterovibrio baiacu]
MKKTHSANTGETVITFGAGVVRKAIGCLFLGFAFYQLGFDNVESPSFVFVWASLAAFGWHMAFARHYVTVNRRKGLMTRVISSVYPVYRFEANLDAVRGFVVARAKHRRDQHGLKVHQIFVLFASGERHPFLAGNKAKLIVEGREIAALCDKPFVVDEEST